MDLIYALTCPVTGEIRYVGKTRNPATRLGSHMSAARHGGRTRNAKWLLSIDRKGLMPGFVVLHRAAAFSWQTMERFFIASCRHVGAELNNGTDGGEGVSLSPEDLERVKQLRRDGFTTEVTTRMSVSIKASWQREDIRARRVEANKMAGAQPEQRKRLAAIAKLPRSEEARARQKAGRDAYWADPANRARAAERMRAVGKANAKP